MKILFIESRSEYERLIEIEVGFFFDGYKFYKREPSFFKRFDVVVSRSYHSAICNVIINKARIEGVKTILVTDGIVEWNNCIAHPAVIKFNEVLFSNIRHDLLFCPGIQVSNLISRKRGMPFLSKNIINDMAIRNSGDTEYDVLITTANTPAFDDGELSILISLISSVIEASIKKNLKVCTRISNTSILNEILSYGVDNFTDEEFNKFLVRGKVLFTTPSTVALSAMFSEFPVCQFNYRFNPIILQTGWMLAHEIMASGVIDSMLSMTEYNMRYQRRVAAEFNKTTPFSEGGAIDADGIFQSSLPSQAIQYDALKALESRFNFNVEYALRKLRDNFTSLLRKLVIR